MEEDKDSPPSSLEAREEDENKGHEGQDTARRVMPPPLAARREKEEDKALPRHVPPRALCAL